MKRQPKIVFQQDVYVCHKLEILRQSGNRENVAGAKPTLEKQVSGEKEQRRAFTGELIGIVCSRTNIQRAYRQVKRNNGVAGIDNMSVLSFKSWFHQEGEHLIEELLKGDYRPSAVKAVSIPKAGGGERQLGIPTVKDRIIQQAISQVLSPIWEQLFSDKSYGFRPNRRAIMALRKAQEYVESGRTIVVDMDMKSFFDEVHHDRLMYRISRIISDERLLHLIRRYLQSGVLQGGLVSQRIKGTPQGSPLSPLLSNIVLDELDKELERRGHCFVRYADDFSIFVRSQEAGERVRKSISVYLTKRLKLLVNDTKSVVCSCSQTKFLGYTVLENGMLVISQTNIERLKEKIREKTRRNRGVSFNKVIDELNPLLRGWLQYFKYAKCKSRLKDLDSWIRRKLRCYRLKQCKKVIGVKRFLNKMGVSKWQSWILALSGKGWWRKSSCPQSHQAMNLLWFDFVGLYNMSLEYDLLQN